MAQLSATGEPPSSLSFVPSSWWTKPPSASAPAASMATSAPSQPVVRFISTTMSL